MINRIKEGWRWFRLFCYYRDIGDVDGLNSLCAPKPHKVFIPNDDLFFMGNEGIEKVEYDSR